MTNTFSTELHIPSLSFTVTIAIRCAQSIPTSVRDRLGFTTQGKSITSPSNIFQTSEFSNFWYNDQSRALLSSPAQLNFRRITVSSKPMSHLPCHDELWPFDVNRTFLSIDRSSRATGWVSLDPARKTAEDSYIQLSSAINYNNYDTRCVKMY